MSNPYLDAVRSAAPLYAGAAVADITPTGSVFLAGYPHVRRYSTGVHDPLSASALYLESCGERLLLIACDVIYVPKSAVARARTRIADVTGIPAGHILISATHTHSGPKMLDPIATSEDGIVPRSDPAIVQHVEDRIVDAALRAARDSEPAELGLTAQLQIDPRDMGGGRAVAVRLAGAAPKRVKLELIHPTLQALDDSVMLTRTGDVYSGVVRLPESRMYVQVTDDGGSWRLDGQLQAGQSAIDLAARP